MLLADFSHYPLCRAPYLRHRPRRLRLMDCMRRGMVLRQRRRREGRSFLYRVHLGNNERGRRHASTNAPPTRNLCRRQPRAVLPGASVRTAMQRPSRLGFPLW